MPLFTFALQNGVAVMVPVQNRDTPPMSNATATATAAEAGEGPLTHQEQRDEYWLWHAGELMSNGQNRSSEWRVEE